MNFLLRINNFSTVRFTIQKSLQLNSSVQNRSLIILWVSFRCELELSSVIFAKSWSDIFMWWLCKDGRERVSYFWNIAVSKMFELYQFGFKNAKLWKKFNTQVANFFYHYFYFLRYKWKTRVSFWCIFSILSIFLLLCLPLNTTWNLCTQKLGASEWRKSTKISFSFFPLQIAKLSVRHMLWEEEKVPFIFYWHRKNDNYCFRDFFTISLEQRNYPFYFIFVRELELKLLVVIFIFYISKYVWWQ